MGGPHSPLLDAKRPELESAIARPRNLAYYEQADLVRQAVALVVGISQSQAFLDGNKRTALGVMVAFLYGNGGRFVGIAMDLARWIERVAEETDRAARAALVEEFEGWLRANVRVIEPQA